MKDHLPNSPQKQKNLILTLWKHIIPPLSYVQIRVQIMSGNIPIRILLIHSAVCSHALIKSRILAICIVVGGSKKRPNVIWVPIIWQRNNLLTIDDRQNVPFIKKMSKINMTRGMSPFFGAPIGDIVSHQSPFPPISSKSIRKIKGF